MSCLFIERFDAESYVKNFQWNSSYETLFRKFYFNTISQLFIDLSICRHIHIRIWLFIFVFKLVLFSFLWDLTITSENIASLFVSFIKKLLYHNIIEFFAKIILYRHFNWINKFLWIYVINRFARNSRLTRIERFERWIRLPWVARTTRLAR